MPSSCPVNNVLQGAVENLIADRAANVGPDGKIISKHSDNRTKVDRNIIDKYKKQKRT
jgi:hypothetical protein